MSIWFVRSNYKVYFHFPEHLDGSEYHLLSDFDTSPQILPAIFKVLLPITLVCLFQIALLIQLPLLLSVFLGLQFPPIKHHKWLNLVFLKQLDHFENVVQILVRIVSLIVSVILIDFESTTVDSFVEPTHDVYSQGFPFELFQTPVLSDFFKKRVESFYSHSNILCDLSL